MRAGHGLIAALLMVMCVPVVRVAGQATPPVVVRVEPRWIEGSSSFWYKRDGAEGPAWLLVDPLAGTRAPLFDLDQLSAALREAGAPVGERAQVLGVGVRAGGIVVVRVAGDRRAWVWDAGRVRVAIDEEAEGLAGEGVLSRRPRRSRSSADETSITFSNARADTVRLLWVTAEGARHAYGELAPGATRDQHTFVGHAWVVVAGDGTDIGFTEGAEAPRTVRISDAADDAEPAAPRRPRREPRRRAMTPEGAPEMLVRDHNLVFRRRDAEGTGEAMVLTSDGSPGVRYDGPFHWSPDASHVVAMRRTPGGDRRVTYVQSSPGDQTQPQLRSYAYLKPGDDIPQAWPCLFNVETRSEVALDRSLFENPWDIRDVHWSPDGSRFMFVYNQRGHTVMRVLSVDAASGVVTPVVNEECATFFDYASKYFIEYLDGSDELIWMSERDGWNHLYLLDSRTGAVKSRITSGEWVVRGVERVDAEARQVWFRAMGVFQGQDPYHVHYGRVGFDGGGLTWLTAGDGTHRIEYSPDGEHYLDVYSRVDLPPVTELRRSADGSLVTRLEGPENDEPSPGQSTPQRFRAKGRDGVTDIWGMIHRPTGFDRSRKYPVIEQIYAGPHDHHVPKDYRASWGYAQELADRGFIVVRIDGMGTNWRSKAFHDVAWKNLKDAGFPDRIAWMRAAAAAHPEIDLDNGGRGVGIFGGSAGGQNALAALLWHGDFYKVAVADCGCHDNRMDKIWWNELWMSWPVGDHYSASSNVVHAGLLRDDGRLMLVVGEMDENVDPASTMQVVDALVKADRDFELLVMPGVGHGAAETPYASRRRARFLERHLKGTP